MEIRQRSVPQLFFKTADKIWGHVGSPEIAINYRKKLATMPRAGQEAAVTVPSG